MSEALVVQGTTYTSQEETTYSNGHVKTDYHHGNTRALERPHTAKEMTTRTMEISRMPQDVPRTQRSSCRTTLYPSVHNFSGKIISRAADEDQMVWIVGGRHRVHVIPPHTHVTSFARAGVGAAGLGPFPYLETPPSASSAMRLPVVSGVYTSERVAAWTEDVHRRHVARTARARARLSPKPHSKVVPASTTAVSPVVGGGGGAGGGGMVMDNLDKPLILPLKDYGDHVEDMRLVTSSRMNSVSDGMMTSRSRPATTGRYFDTSNGLKNSTVLRSRPHTASMRWAGPGLKIQKITLRSKELMT